MLNTSPTAREIIAAVREFLETEVVPSTDDALSFHARVAARLLATLEREKDLEPEATERYRESLSDLGVADEDELCVRIRAGELRPDSPGLLDALLSITRDRLASWNPTYAEAPDDDDPRVIPAANARP